MIRVAAMLLALTSTARAETLGVRSLVDLAETRCLAPMMAGQPGDAAGLEQVAVPLLFAAVSREQEYSDPSSGLRLSQLTGEGPYVCTVLVPVASDADALAANLDLADRLRGDFVERTSPCDTSRFTQLREYESIAPHGRGNLIRVSSAVRQDENHHSFQSVTVSEFDAEGAPVRHCHEYGSPSFADKALQ